MDELYFNGINGSSGRYALVPMASEQLTRFIQGEGRPEELAELSYRWQRQDARHFGLEEGRDPRVLSEAGWAAVFPHDSDPAIREALKPLLEHRQQAAGDYFRLFDGEAGVRPGENKNAFTKRHKVGPGPAQPSRLPYYVMLVGGPEKISERFQSQLDIQYAVGRLYFERVEDYAAYAEQVVAVETGQISRRARRMDFFAVENPDDKATEMSASLLAAPLAQTLGERWSNWSFPILDQGAATKAALLEILAQKAAPACLFTASHGMAFDLGDARQLPHQGALLCQDWPGPNAWQQPIPQDFYLAAEDLPSDLDLRGLISFHFACYGAGTPQFDEFAQQAFQQRQAIAPRPFVAALPQAMLRRGALAFVGHVERAWSYSFRWPGAGAQNAVFESLFQALLDGCPIGHALDPFNIRHAEISVMLADQLEEAEFGAELDPYEIAGLWTANNDARGWALLGDPAVCLAIAP